MKIALIGRGRVATHLLKALLQAGHEVISVNSRTLEELPLVADIYILSVKDSALQDVIHNAVKGREGQLFVHTAGSMPMDLFKGCCARWTSMRYRCSSRPPMLRRLSKSMRWLIPSANTSMSSLLPTAAICTLLLSLPATSPTTAIRWLPTCWHRRDCLSTSCCRSSTRQPVRSTSCTQWMPRRDLPCVATRM